MAIILAVLCLSISTNILLLLGILLVISFLFKRSKLVVFFSLTLVAGGFFWFSDNQNSSQHAAGELTGTVTLNDGIVIDGDAFRAQVLYQGERFQLSYKITSEQEQKEFMKLNYGDQLQVAGELEAPEQNRNKNQFNYQAFLYRKQVHWLLKTNTVQPMAGKSTSWIYSLKKFSEKTIGKDRHRNGPPNCSIHRLPNIWR